MVASVRVCALLVSRGSKESACANSRHGFAYSRTFQSQVHSLRYFRCFKCAQYLHECRHFTCKLKIESYVYHSRPHAPPRARARVCCTTSLPWNEQLFFAYREPAARCVASCRLRESDLAAQQLLEMCRQCAGHAPPELFGPESCGSLECPVFFERHRAKLKGQEARELCDALGLLST